VESQAYTNEFIYYHPECLKVVLGSSERYIGHLDSAIQIQDFIDRDNHRYQEKIRAAQFKIQQAWNAYERTRDPETTPGRDRLLRVTPSDHVTYTVTESAGVPNSEQEIEESEQKSVDVKNTENPKPIQGPGPGRYDLLKKNASLDNPQ
jgi:hypothetical protein